MLLKLRSWQTSMFRTTVYLHGSRHSDYTISSVAYQTYGHTYIHEFILSTLCKQNNFAVQLSQSANAI